MAFQLHQIGTTWQYTIKWHLGKTDSPVTENQSQQSVVAVTSKPRQQSDKGLITVDSWTSDPSSNNGSLAIYVRVGVGSSPVLGAKVSAKLQVLLVNGTSLEFAPMELLDDGFAGKKYKKYICIVISYLY